MVVVRGVNVFPSAVENVIREFPEVEEFRVEIFERHAMLRLPEFNYIQPRTLKQATKALADLGRDAMLVAGGTDVYPKMKRGQFTPRNLVSLRALRELKGIRQNNDGLWIGAGESLTIVSHHRLISKHLPALAHEARFAGDSLLIPVDH